MFIDIYGFLRTTEEKAVRLVLIGHSDGSTHNIGQRRAPIIFLEAYLRAYLLVLLENCTPSMLSCGRKTRVPTQGVNVMSGVGVYPLVDFTFPTAGPSGTYCLDEPVHYHCGVLQEHYSLLF